MVSIISMMIPSGKVRLSFVHEEGYMYLAVVSKDHMKVDLGYLNVII